MIATLTGVVLTARLVGVNRTVTGSGADFKIGWEMIPTVFTFIGGNTDSEICWSKPRVVMLIARWH